jgi:hypothetical protein
MGLWGSCLPLLFGPFFINIASRFIQIFFTEWKAMAAFALPVGIFTELLLSLPNERSVLMGSARQEIACLFLLGYCNHFRFFHLCRRQLKTDRPV